MVTGQFTNSLLARAEEVRHSWAWFLFLGLLLIAAGILCIVADVTATFVTVFAFGWLLLFTGIIALVNAFRVHRWSGFFLHLLSALLRGFTGYLLIRYPLAGAVGLTLILAFFFIVGGLFRAIGAAELRLPSWGWSVASGIISVVLGFILLGALPVFSLWFIGFAIGIDMILEGVSLVAFATGLHNLPRIVSYDIDKAA
jgi:uncharacterized membrane protein HdeD (DUF308 family)